MKNADLAIIGSGIACTATLIEVFNRLLTYPQPKLSITVIEKHPEFWLGIPYGARSSVNALTITSIHDFFTDDVERAAFLEWFEQHQEELINHYLIAGESTARQWLQRNSVFLKNKDWRKVYLPRYFCGRFQIFKFEKIFKIVEEKNLAKLHIINGEAIEIQPKGDAYLITYECDFKIGNLTAAKVVLATGSAPVKKIEWPYAEGAITIINDLYSPGTKQNIAQLVSVLAATENIQERNVLIVGSNASSIELLYLLAGTTEATGLINKLVVLSRSGLLPYPIVNKSQDHYPTENLDKLKGKSDYTIETLVEAAKKDINVAVKDGVIVAYIEKIICYTFELLQPLDDDAKKAFIGLHGMQLSNLFRRSGVDYKTGAGLLSEMQKLELLKGSFSSIEPNRGNALLHFTDTDSQQKLTYPLSFKIIINCTGSDDLDRSPDKLIHHLVHSGLAKVNLSRKGLLVNENFEAAPNLYVMGPLLGGNKNNRIHFWHLENASRILFLAPYLAEALVV